MHTYRRTEGGSWQAGYQFPEEPRFRPLGPVVDFEWEAAAIASFLNGGRYCPDEIAPIFAVPVDDEEDDDDSVHPDRPKELEDYPIARKRKCQPAACDGQGAAGV